MWAGMLSRNDAPEIASASSMFVSAFTFAPFNPAKRLTVPGL